MIWYSKFSKLVFNLNVLKSKNVQTRDLNVLKCFYSISPKYNRILNPFQLLNDKHYLNPTSNP